MGVFGYDIHLHNTHGDPKANAIPTTLQRVPPGLSHLPLSGGLLRLRVVLKLHVVQRHLLVHSSGLQLASILLHRAS